MVSVQMHLEYSKYCIVFSGDRTDSVIVYSVLKWKYINQYNIGSPTDHNG